MNNMSCFADRETIVIKYFLGFVVIHIRTFYFYNELCGLSENKHILSSMWHK